jgi:3-oxoacyl-[acyl-carrier protein] reductase
MEFNMFNLTDKKAIITGASGGIGSSIAKGLYAQGATVVLSGTRVDTLNSLAKGLGERAFVIPCDLSNFEEPKRLISDCNDLMGGVDILVNNAGLTQDNLAMRMKDEDWSRVLDVNLTASFLLSKACLRGMMKQRFGRIINITSIVGITGNAGQVNYAASKAGLIGMSKSLAQEVASRGITVNCVAPGFIATPMTETLSNDQKDNLLSSTPIRRLGEGRDIAASVIYLASDEASYVTGHTLHVNGGMVMV